MHGILLASLEIYVAKAIQIAAYPTTLIDIRIHHFLDCSSLAIASYVRISNGFGIGTGRNVRPTNESYKIPIIATN